MFGFSLIRSEHAQVVFLVIEVEVVLVPLVRSVDASCRCSCSFLPDDVYGAVVTVRVAGRSEERVASLTAVTDGILYSLETTAPWKDAPVW